MNFLDFSSCFFKYVSLDGSRNSCNNHYRVDSRNRSWGISVYFNKSSAILRGIFLEIPRKVFFQKFIYKFFREFLCTEKSSRDSDSVELCKNFRQVFSIFLEIFFPFLNSISKTRKFTLKIIFVLKSLQNICLISC